MKRWWGIALIGALSAASAHGAVMITEIMYNSAGDSTWGDGAGSPNCTEWVELYNSGPAVVDISGWKLDDEDATNWGPIPAGSVLQPGEVAILCDVTQEADFRSFWGVPSGLKVFQVTWAALANSASATNEVLVLLDAANTEMDKANYEAGTNGWPASTDGRSIYLKDISLDNNVGANWGLSAPGVDGAWSPAATVGKFRGTDGGLSGNVGSPGYVVPEPSCLLLLALGLGLKAARRRVF